VLVEIGLITPPVGMNLFVLQGIGKISLAEIVYGAIPFFFVMVLAIPLFYAWPDIVLWLPAKMK
jgi:TRAP-type C4-dicarboxylate transport system permease large subunit